MRDKLSSLYKTNSMKGGARPMFMITFYNKLSQIGMADLDTRSAPVRR